MAWVLAVPFLICCWITWYLADSVGMNLKIISNMWVESLVKEPSGLV